MKIFDYLNELTLKEGKINIHDEETRHGYKPFFINRWISMTELYIPIVNEINKYELPKESHFEYYNSIIPKHKQFFKYIKKPKDITTEEKIYIADFFECGIKEAEEFIKYIDEKELNLIIDFYKNNGGSNINS